MNRYQFPSIKKDLETKMVLLSGPRQVGKSWLAKKLMEGFEHPLYLNYDNSEDRKIILQQGWPGNTEFLVLDEIHKLDKWKNYLKGIWDTKPKGLRLLITGSARLETFRQSGDSLAGRYYHHRLLPITPAEAESSGLRRNLSHHCERGGFPEPWLAEIPADAGRWRRQYLDSLVREDILTFENIQQLKSMNLLVELLRTRVASPLSYQGLAEDLSLSPNTVKHYISILEALYIIFLVRPFHRNIARSLIQQPKVYFFDTGLVKGNGGQQLENLVALSLLKELYRSEDQDGLARNLAYLRTKEGHEVDFLLVKEDSPELMIEVKTSDRAIHQGLRYFHERYQIPGLQLVQDLRLEDHSGPLKLLRAHDWLCGFQGL